MVFIVVNYVVLLFIILINCQSPYLPFSDYLNHKIYAMYIKLYKTNEYSYDQMLEKMQNSFFVFKVKIILLLQ